MNDIDRSAGEPNCITALELLPILEELSAFEPIFHQPALGTTRAELERATVEDFWEIGASGRRYSRAFVLDALEQRAADPAAERWRTSDLHCRKLGPDVYLLTYTLVQDNNRLTRRSTIWQKTAEGWKIVYHQGTVVQDA